MSTEFDGSEATFFEFLKEYEALIKKHIPGTFIFEYISRLYMLPVYRHLERVRQVVGPGARVLDLGCGRGHFSAYLSRRGLKMEGLEVPNPVAGDDFLHNQDPKLIEYYPSLWQESNQTYGSHCRYYDGKALPFPDASLDAVLYYASFEHIPVDVLPQVVADTYRVLKPGGKAFVYRCPSALAWKEHLTRAINIGAHEKLYGKSEALNILKGAGYKVLSFQRSDVFPGYVGPFQDPYNHLAKFLLAIESVLRYTPLAFIFHHFEIELEKPA